MQETILLSIPLSEFQKIIFESVNACLDHRSPQSNNLESKDQILTIKEAADLVRLSVPSMYKLCSDGTIPSIRRGRKIMFSKSELLTWIMTGQKKTLQQIERDSLSTT